MTSNFWYFLLCFGLVAAFRPSSLKCPPCDVSKCGDSGSCTSGITWDVCHCCETCAKSLGEECGGPWNAYGQCGFGLKCFKDIRECPYLFNSRNIRSVQSSKMCGDYFFNAIGRCVQESNLISVYKRFGITNKLMEGQSSTSGKNDLNSKRHNKTTPITGLGPSLPGEEEFSQKRILLSGVVREYEY